MANMQLSIASTTLAEAPYFTISFCLMESNISALLLELVSVAWAFESWERLCYTISLDGSGEVDRDNEAIITFSVILTIKIN